jgi:hypothetical protein
MFGKLKKLFDWRRPNVIDVPDECEGQEIKQTAPQAKPTEEESRARCIENFPADSIDWAKKIAAGRTRDHLAARAKQDQKDAREAKKEDQRER